VKMHNKGSTPRDLGDLHVTNKKKVKESAANLPGGMGKIEKKKREEEKWGKGGDGTKGGRAGRDRRGDRGAGSVGGSWLKRLPIVLIKRGRTGKGFLAGGRGMVPRGGKTGRQTTVKVGAGEKIKRRKGESNS